MLIDGFSKSKLLHGKLNVSWKLNHANFCILRGSVIAFFELGNVSLYRQLRVTVPGKDENCLPRHLLQRSSKLHVRRGQLLSN